MDLRSGPIHDLHGNAFEGAGRNHVLVDPQADTDRDGLSDGDEVKSYLSYPTRTDSGGDGLMDSDEA